MEKIKSASTGADQLVHRQAWRVHSRTIISLGGGIICLPIAVYLFLNGLLHIPTSQILDWIFMIIFSVGVVLFLGGVSSYVIAVFAYNAQKRRVIETSRDAVVESLIQRVQENDFGPDQAVITILGDLGSRNATPTLISALKSRDENVRKKAAQSLGKIKDELAVEPLSAALKDTDDGVRVKAARVLDRLGWKPSNDTEKARYFIATGQWDEVKKLGEVGIDPVIEVLRDKSSSIRKEAVKTLGKIGDKRALGPLTEALKDTDQAVRESAKAALHSIQKKP